VSLSLFFYLAFLFSLLARRMSGSNGLDIQKCTLVAGRKVCCEEYVDCAERKVLDRKSRTRRLGGREQGKQRRRSSGLASLFSVTLTCYFCRDYKIFYIDSTLRVEDDLMCKERSSGYSL
jgi:hypothetical protein